MEGKDGVAVERRVALAVLRRVDGGAFADRAFAGEARRAGLEGRERARANRLAYGAVQRRRTLDWLVDGALVRPERPLEPALRDVLRLGSFEIAYSDGVPARAAVDQAVRLARGLGGGAARARARAGLANAVLRRLADEAGERLASLDDAEPQGAALRHSVPDWIAVRLFDALGREAALATLRAANEPAEPALRWNPLRGPRASLEAALPPGYRSDAAIPEAYVLPGAFPLETTEAWRRGRAIGQSRASMIPARALAPQPGERILDLCGAPGAKASHLAALAQNRCRITSVELRPARARTLRALAARLGALVEVVEGDACTVDLDGPFDAALVDPPCTGLGVLSARPDARWRRREEAIAPLQELQSALLRRALTQVRPGGRVVYATCTLLAEENEDVIGACGARVDDLTERFPGLAHPALPGALLTLPGRDGTDGFFVARLIAGGLN